MKQLLVLKASPIYAQNKVFTTNETAPQPSDLAEGAVGIYAVGSNGKLSLVTAASGLADVKEFVIARGMPATLSPMTSDFIERGNGYSFEKSAAVAGTAKVISFGGTTSALTGGVTTIPAKSTAGLIIQDTSKPNIFDRKGISYEYTTKVANEDTATIAAGLVAAINADPNAIVVASTTGATTAGVLVLTAKKVGKSFDAYMFDYGISAGSSKVVTTAPVNSIGTYDKVRALEIETEAYQGRTNYSDSTTGPTLAYSQTEVGVAYGIYQINYIANITRLGVPVDAVASRFKRVYLAVPTGATGASALDTLLAAVGKPWLATAEMEDGTGS